MSQMYVPEGWELHKLSECCKALSGYSFKSNLFDKNEGIPLIRIRDLNTNSTVTRFRGKYEEKYLVKKNDFLIGMDGDFKIYQWKGTEALLNQRVCKLYDFKSNVNPKFIFYSIQEHLRKIHQNTSFTTVKHISIYQILDIELSLPKKNLQDKIVKKTRLCFRKT